MCVRQNSNGIMAKPKQSDPIALFAEWLAAAEASEPAVPSAMSLATANAEGVPSIRMVLLRGLDERGFVFYTNTQSRKGEEIRANPNAALCFHWKSLGRQVRIEGPLAPVEAHEADAYFADRARGSQIGAWASDQSRPLPSRRALEKQVAKFAARFGLAKVPRPEHWSGYRVTPVHIEFWREARFRLHERIVYHRGEDGWTSQRLFP
ncbi:MAG: pyridoxamine 5'-phosphate oxidase [Alphaproteobacteria bacterium]